jgi:hypothetical protein
MGIFGTFLAAVVLTFGIYVPPASAKANPSTNTGSPSPQGPSNCSPSSPDPQKVLAPGQPLQIQLIMPPQAEKPEPPKSFTEVWGAVIVGCMSAVVAIGGLFVATSTVNKQVKASESSMNHQLENELKKIDEQNKNRKKGLLMFLAVETFHLESRTSTLKNQTRNFNPTNDEELKRLRISLPRVLETDWSDLALLDDSLLLSYVTLLTQGLQRLERRLEYLLSRSPDRRSDDPISLKYFQEMSSLFEDCERTARKILEQLKDTSEILRSQINDLEERERIDQTGVTTEPRSETT